jgi:hypothetical protein
LRLRRSWPPGSPLLTVVPADTTGISGRAEQSTSSEFE